MSRFKTEKGIVKTYGSLDIGPNERFALIDKLIESYLTKSDFPNSELTKQALSNVFEVWACQKKLMFHLDQGCHYTRLTFSVSLHS